MDKVCIEVVGQGDIGNRSVSLRTLGDDLGFKGLGIGTAFLWHGRPLKKARNGIHLNLGGHHRLKRWHQEGVLPGRLRNDHLRYKMILAARTRAVPVEQWSGPGSEVQINFRDIRRRGDHGL